MAPDPDTVSRFHDRADDYRRFRPSYPAAAVDAVLAGLAAPDTLTVADVGAGTGIFSRLLGDRGCRVVAVEPGAAMRAAAEPHARVEWVAASAEALPLRDGCIDLVVSAQAFHWFDQPVALAQFARALTRHGRLALVWNVRGREHPVTGAYQRIFDDLGAMLPGGRAPFDMATTGASGHFAPAEHLTFVNPHRLDVDSLIGRARSASYAPKSGAAGDTLVAELRALHAAHANKDGLIDFPETTHVYRTQIG